MKLAVALCLVLAAAAQPVEETTVVMLFPAGTLAGEADGAILRAGLTILNHPDLLPWQRLVRGPAEAVRTLRVSGLVTDTFPASRDLTAGSPVHACAEGAARLEGKTTVRAAALGEGWGRDSFLTWSVASYPDTLTRMEVDSILERALGEWSRHAALHFTRTEQQRGRRNLEFLFGRGDHGDGYPFAAGANVLAHAFYPPSFNPEPVAGDIHLNADAGWSAGGDHDLYSAALHEVGHALGLAHSATPGSVMYPWYRQLTELSNEDAEDLQGLYGKSDEARLTLTPHTPAVTEAASIELMGIVSGGSGAVTITWWANGSSGVAQGGRSWRTAAVPLRPGLNSIALSAIDEFGQSCTETVSVVRSVPAAPPTPVVLAVPQPAAPQPAAPVPAPASATPATPAPAPPAPTPTAPAGDRVAPQMAVTSPAGSMLVTSQPSLRVSGTARDASGIAQVTWEAAAGSGLADGTTNWTANVPLLVGDNPVVIRVRDTAGNASWRSLLIVRR